MPYQENTPRQAADQGLSRAKLRLKLIENGYVPLPACGKAVKLSGWRDVQPDAAQVRAWDAERPQDTNTGIRLGGGLVAIDIDVLDSDTARQLADKFERMTQGDTLPPLRIGMAPKCLLLVRVKDQQRKMITGDWYDEDGRKHAVEVLAEGQQFIAYGTHPDTGKAYTWADGFDPRHVKAADLPTITGEQLQEFLGEAVALFEQRGWVQKGEASLGAHRKGRGKSGVDWDTILDALDYIPNDDMDWQIWSDMAMALHEESGGSEEGLRAFMAWSAQSKKHNPRVTRRRWDGFIAGGEGNIGGGTILSIARRHGWGEVTAADFEDDPDGEDDEEMIAEDAARVKPGAGLLTFTAPADLSLKTARKPIIKGLIAAGDVGCIVGAPGVGKSLIAPRLAWAVAQGKDVFGLKVRQAHKVFYVAAEDEHGMRARMMALRDRHGDAPDLRLVGGVSDLLSKSAPQLKALLAAVKAERPALVIIDTLAMAFPGLEENSAEGMGRVVAVARALAQWGAAVLMVHHDTKDGQQGLPRGHSLLNGALDVSLHLKRGDSGIVRGTLTKNRNGSCDLDIAFRIGVVELGHDEDGEAVTAGICEPCAADQEARKPKLSKNERAALTALRNIAEADGRASFNAWRQLCVAGGDVFTASSSAARRARFAEALKALVAKDRISIADDVVQVLGFAAITAADFEDDSDE